MWTSTHEAHTTATPDRVYALLSDVSTWPRWNAGVSRIDLDGAFRAGARAVMHFPDGEALPFSITWAEPGRGYEDLTAVPDARVEVRVRHEIEGEESGSRIRYLCTVTGAGEDTCAQIGHEVTADFDGVLAALSAAAAK